MDITRPPIEPNPEADLAFLEETFKAKAQEQQVVKKLATHIHGVWTQVQKDNKYPRLDMVNTLRRVRGEYEPKKLSAIQAFKGSETFLRVGENKCRAAESWLKDIYRGAKDVPWDIEPTAVPDLPDETMEQIKLETQQQAMMVEQELLAQGLPIDPNKMSKLLNDYYQEMLDKAKKDLSMEAKERVQRAALVIRDQNQEGGWNNAFKDFLYYFTRLKYGIIKGPILTKKPKTFWKVTEMGYELVTEDVLVHDVYAVSPFNWYPSRGMRTVNDGDIIEIHELTKASLAGMIGVPGYSETEIRAVLDKYQKGELKSKWFTVDDETMVKQVTTNRTLTNQTNPPTSSIPDDNTEKIFAQEFYGSVSGKLLIEWGMTEPLDPEMQYQVNCWKIGDHVIKAVINPDALGRKPYHVSSWAKNPEWIVGEGLLEFAGPIEDAINAITRAIINNIAIASGPMCEIDKDRVDTKIPIYPWRQIESTSMQMRNEGPAVNYYQPNMHANELILAWTHFSRVLDEMTVPAYAQGASQSGVTAGTATVFTQLLAAASRSIKAVAANIDDDIISPYIQMCYDNLMKFSDDDTLKGDARVVAGGVRLLQAKEQAAQRKVEYLQVIANPTYQQILGAKNVGAILADIAKSNDIELPDMQRLDGNETTEMIIQSMLLSQAGFKEASPIQENGQVAQGGGAAANPQGLNADGAKAGVAQT